MASFDVDFVAACVDEIALEGLDGITINTFWQRLQNRQKFPINVDEKSKPFLFEAVVANKDVEFYELPTPRPPLVIFNRYDHIDPELGIVVEPEDLPEDIYPINVIDENGIRGSCSTFHVRKNITEQLRFDGCPLVTLEQAVARWGEKLVMVAVQSARNVALMGTEVDPQIELSPMQYCMLEKIGRTRFLGEVTQGKTGLAALNESPKTLHYYRKLLMKKRLITKQLHYQKNSNGQTASGSLLLLARFHVERQSKMQMMLQRMCETLATKPNNIELFHKLRSELGMKETSFKKLFQNSFQKCVKTYMIPYKHMFPDAPDKEAFLQNGKERMVKICKLVHPYNSQEEEEEEDDDVDEDDERVIGAHSAFFDPNNFLQDKPLLSQAYDVVEAEGPEGITAQELGRRLGLPKLETRLLCRNLERRGVVMTIMQDMGRQRVTKYISKCHEHDSEPHKKFLEERKRILEFQNKALGENDKENASSMSSAGERATTSNAGAEKILKSEKDGGQVRVTRTSFTDDLKRAFDHSRRDATHITYRVLKRANMIIEAVRNSKLIDEMFKLQKLIVEKETEEGYHRKVDKKSVMRLVHRLAKDGYVRSIKTILRLGDQVKKLHFVCDPSITVDDPLVKNTIEQAKFKYFGASKEQTKKATQQSSSLEEEPRSIRHSVSKLRQLCSKGDGIAQMEYVPSIGRVYGLLPKFLRAKTLHLFLVYLVYDYQGHVPDESVQQTWPKSYTDTKDWKMFVPPLPKHPGVAKGWCLISDILLSLPLSILVKVVNITFRIEGLTDYLDDPVKRHYLVRYLPRKMRSALLYARRYIFTVYNVMVRLAYMGLVSFGPQNHKEKDQVFVYVHRITTVKDTTQSKPSYFLISDDIDYPIRSYNLDTVQDVENYWLELETVCLHTPLGSINAARGQSIVIENAYTKPDLVEAARNKPEDDVKDDGSIPGDGKGAGGLDSALFSHLKRNWTPASCNATPLQKRTLRSRPQSNEANRNYVKYLKERAQGVDGGSGGGDQSGNRQKRLQRLTDQTGLSVHFPKSLGENAAPMPVKVSVRPMVKRGKKRKLEETEKEPPAKKIESKAKRKCVERIVERKIYRIRRPYYDEEDKAALDRRKKQRVSWSLQEDSFLLVCKVASKILWPKGNGMIVPYTVVRDELHKRFEIAKDKTSRACQRRIRYMLLNPETISNVSIFLTEARQDTQLMKMFEGKKPSRFCEEEWSKMFVVVLEYLLKKFTGNKQPVHEIKIPDTLEELRAKFSLMLPGNLDETKQIHTEPKNVVDIHYNLVVNIIISSLFTVDDKNNWSYLLYKIYSQYPDNLLKSVMTRLQACQIITKNKSYARRLAGIMPLWSLPCKLSITYHNTLISKYPQGLYEECFALFDALYNQKTEDEYPDVVVNSLVSAGSCLCVIGLQGLSKLSFRIIVPEQIVSLDQSLSSSSMNIYFREQLLDLQKQKLAPAGKAALDTRATGESSDGAKNRSDNIHFESLASGKSRLALYLLRGRSDKLHCENVENMQDYFVINSCTLECHIKKGRNTDSGNRISNVMDDEKLLKIDQKIATRIIQSQLTYWPMECTPVTTETLLQQCQECSLPPFETEVAKRAMVVIIQKRELGVTLKELWEELGRVELASLKSAMKFLTDTEFVIRVGIIEFRYVAMWFSNPWTVHSFKIPREYKSLLSDMFGQQLQQAKSGSSSTELTSTTPAPETLDMATTSEEGNIKAKDKDESPKETEPLRSLRVRKRRKLDPSKRVFNTDDWEKVRFVGRIWRKADGTFNRSVMLKFMSSILSYIVSNPGVTKGKICKKFYLAIPPVQLMEILEYLEDLQCIQSFYVTESHKPSLFSKPAKIEVVQQTTPDQIERIEPTEDAFIRLSQFFDKLVIKHIYL